MNERAQIIYHRLRAEAKRGDPLQYFGDVYVRYYPASNRYSWFYAGKRDITHPLTKQQVISLINIELHDREQRHG